MNHLHWLIPERFSLDLYALKKSKLASIRLRAAPSISSALQLGWKVTYGNSIVDAPSILLIGKIGANDIEVRQALWMDQIYQAKGITKIILDYTDHHLGFDSPMSNFYESVIKIVDGCVVPSGSMAKLLLKRFNGSINVIEDPLEISTIPPKENSKKPITLLWFGHSSNVDFLVHFLSTGFHVGDHIRLIALSNEAGLSHLTNSNLVSNAKIEFNLAIWSLENMVEAAKIADMCIIPSDLNNPKKVGVSSNRLITALTLGLPTAADNLLSYKEFDSYYCDLHGDNFRELLNDPSRFRQIVIQAQTDLTRRFSMSKIEEDWQTFFISLTS
jgi:hypothetical protein